MYDVAIIGGGVTGSLIARELSRFDINICILEKDFDIAMGTSKANSSIVHAGYDALPTSLSARLNVQGNKLMEQVCSDLDVPFKRIGSLVLAFCDEDLNSLKKLYQQGIENGVEGIRILSKEETLEIEPKVSNEITASLYAPTAGIVCPYELTVAGIENAISNGAKLFLDFQVAQINLPSNENDFNKITPADNDFVKITSSKGESILAKYVVNAGGVHSDKIANLFNDYSFKITPRKGEYLLFDKSQISLLNKVIFGTPSKFGKGILVTPTVDGNILVGPTAEDINDKENTSTTNQGIQKVILGSKRSVPDLNFRNVITSFSGLRAIPSGAEDFIIKESEVFKNLVHCAGITSPGLSASPAIALMVTEILIELGLNHTKKSSFNPIRKGIPRFLKMTMLERQNLIDQDSLYGNMVCRCEFVTEGEIVEAIRRMPGIANIDGIKRRTRAGMGLCQGGFCSPKVAKIISRELNIPLEEITKFGGSSRLLHSKIKGYEEKHPDSNEK